MTISQDIRELVRHRATYSCEYCGLREADVGGKFTIDHFQPLAHGGSDDVDNLVYSCIWCNQYKQKYWSDSKADKALWNPRLSTSTDHFLLLEDGTLRSLTKAGSVTIERLRLNRPALVSYRMRQRHLTEQKSLLTHQQDLLSVQSELIHRLSALLIEQETLIQRYESIINLLLRRNQ